MLKIPLFAILCQIRENPLIWGSLIWSHHCSEFSVDECDNFVPRFNLSEIFEE